MLSNIHRGALVCKLSGFPQRVLKGSLNFMRVLEKRSQTPLNCSDVNAPLRKEIRGKRWTVVSMD